MKSCVFYILPSIALLGLLSGCVGPLEQAEPSSSASFIEGELEACTSFQAVVSNLDKPPRELQEVLGKQRMILDQSSFPGDFMVEAQGAYLDLLGSLLDKKTNFVNSSVLDIILDESPVFYEDLYFRHTIYRNFCDDMGLEVSGDLLIETMNASGPGDLYTCFESMRSASMEKNSDIAEVYLKATSDSCDGEAQWYRVLDYYPYAMGFQDVSGDELEILCFVYPNSLVCSNP